LGQLSLSMFLLSGVAPTPGFPQLSCSPLALFAAVLVVFPLMLFVSAVRHAAPHFPVHEGRIPPSGQLGALRRALSASRGDSSKIHRGRSRWLLVRRPASSFPQGPFPGTPAPEYMEDPSRSSRKPADGLSERVASLVYAGASRVSEGSWTVAEDRCSVPPAGVTSATVEELVKTARAL
jgi:hypothetical protein